MKNLLDKIRLLQSSVFCLFLLSLQVCYAEVQRLEPANWWVGMKDPSLQLLVYGNDISSYQVDIQYKGVTIESLETTDNPNYLFINLLIAKNTSVGEFKIQFTSSGHSSFSYPFELKQRIPNSANRKGFSSEDVIYLITPDRFANGDPSNDSIDSLKESRNRSDKGGRHGGDIQGIIDHLDYIEEMGFTQIWTMPLMENDMHKYSYHGYSTTDYYKIDPRFGSNNLYRELSKQARMRGIGIIQDVILNHIGSEHWWMKDKPSSDWINNQGVFVGTNHRRESLHDPHAVKSDQVGFNDGWFVPTMPDLNQRNPLLATYLIQNAIWWIEYANLSGLRVDTYSYSDMDFLTQWTRRLMIEYPNLNVVGEEWSTNPAIVAFWQTGSMRHSDYRSYLTSVMDFPTQANLINALTAPETWARGLRELYESLASDFLYGDPYNLVVFADNHDMSRISSQLGEDFALFKMAMAFVLTTRGIPQVFYGTEIFMTNPGTDDHGIIRSDMPGGWEDDESSAFSRSKLTTQQIEAMQFMRTLLNWRKNSSAITHGQLNQYAPENGTYVYFRTSDTQTVMVVLNKNQQSVDLPLKRFKEMLGDASKATDVITQTTIELGQSIQIQAKSALILNIQQ